MKWALSALLITSIAYLMSCTPTHIFSGRVNAEILKAGNIEVFLGDQGRPVASIDHYGENDLAGSVVKDLINHWAKKDLPQWDSDGAKVNAPRILLAKLIRGIDVELVNSYLLNTATKAWSESGSTWLLRSGGDYDFTEVPLTAILYKFGHQPALLYPETKAHVLHKLLIESGDQLRLQVPGSLNLVPDTENHILMTEGSRYLKNQWLRTHDGVTDPKYDNQKNGVEAFLLDYMDELIEAGLFEFNSMPYSGYTITALMNLEAFAEGPVALKARDLLDTIMFKYALSSLDMRRSVPFRRQREKAGTTSIQTDDVSMMSRVWVAIDDPYFKHLAITERIHQAFYTAIMPYRVPDKTLALIKQKENAYFVQLGRGKQASPELYNGGKRYLLSAGGVSRGHYSMIVARPVTLLLSDEATDYRNCFHILGRGSYADWNNTGVFRNFAVSNSPVVIPTWAKPAAVVDGWQVFKVLGSLLVAVFNDEAEGRYGIIALFPDYAGSADSLAKSLAAANSNPKALLNRFVWPKGDTITYDINAPKDQWVMTSFNGELLDRNFDAWPRINSMFSNDSFERDS